MVLASRVAARDLVTVLKAGEPAGRIASLAEEPVVTPRPEFLRLGVRALRSHLFLPSWHEPGSGNLPVLLNPYGGQHLLVATRALGWPSCVSQWFAEQGFAVLVTDGRGSPGRGPAEHCPDLDLERVAIRGWSFGGLLAAGAVMRRPDVFHAAVAGAPTTDQRLYNTHWKERYLGHPDEEPENYDRCSLIADAPVLRRPLLLIHGLADDNVAAAHTLRLSAALLAAGRRHQVLLLPGASHRVTQEDVAENLLHFRSTSSRNHWNVDQVRRIAGSVLLPGPLHHAKVGVADVVQRLDAPAAAHVVGQAGRAGLGGGEVGDRVHGHGSAAQGPDPAVDPDRWVASVGSMWTPS